MCVDFVRTAGRPAYRLLDERFDDDGESGVSLNRPAMQRLMASVRNGRVDVVVVHRLDRLSRRVADCAALLEEFRESGVEMRIAAMPELVGGAFDTLLLNLRSCFAEFERQLIASRISDRRAGLISRGRRIAGRTPYGYSADRETKQLIPKPEQAAIVRELFELTSSGVPPSKVDTIAAVRGWQTRNGWPWTARQVLDTVSTARIEGLNGKLLKTSANTLFGRPVKAIEDLLGFVSDADPKIHRLRSRSYSARGFTRPAPRSASPRSSEASASASSGGPSSSAAPRRSWSHARASSA